MNSVKTITLYPGILCISRTTMPSQMIIAAGLHISSARNSRKNYYEILNISPTATHSEIKSAYYKLTMQYHPDKNASDDAKKKFQEISEAYEVLGNFASRSQYDRMRLARLNPQRSNFRTGGSGYSVRQKENRDPPKYPKNMKIFNFDEWTKQHYGTMFQESQKRKAKTNMKVENFYEEKRNDFKYVYEFEALAVLFAAITLSVSIIIHYIDRDATHNAKPKETKK